jgi:hypothetical protein
MTKKINLICACILWIIAVFLSLTGCWGSTAPQRKEESKEAYIHSRIWLEKLDDVPTATPATLPDALTQIATLKTICTRQLAQLQRMNSEFASMYEINCGMAARQHTDALLEGKTTTPATQSAQPATQAGTGGAK